MVKTTLNTLFIVLFSFQLMQAMGGVPTIATPVAVASQASLNQLLFDAIDKNGPNVAFEVEGFLSRGADANTTDQSGRSPLHYAAENGNKWVIWHLLLNGANSNLQDTIGITPLMLAAMNNNTDAVEKLLDPNALIDIQDTIGRTALICAASQGHVSATRELVQHRANKTLTAQGKTAHDFATEAGYTNCASMIRP